MSLQPSHVVASDIFVAFENAEGAELLIQLLNYENKLQHESHQGDAAYAIWLVSLMCLRKTARRSKVKHFNKLQNRNFCETLWFNRSVVGLRKAI